MEGYFSLKMKRKELDDVNDDFSEFSLSSPARKTRRLNAELPSIIEEKEGVNTPVDFEFPVHSSSSAGGVRIEELPSEAENEERSIVLFKPMKSDPLLRSPSNYSVSVSPDLITGFKNQALWSNQSSSWKLVPDEEGAEGMNSDSSNGCLAMVPWVPSSKLPSPPGSDITSRYDNGEIDDMMDVEETEEVTMDIEESAPSSIFKKNDNNSGWVSIGDGLHQWPQQQQQHRVIPQVQQNTVTPIVWYQ